MTTRLPRLLLAAGVLQLLAAGCVQSRPSRNGVFNENQYVRKDFLVQQWGTTGEDPGWFLVGSITQMSTPNPLGGAGYSLSPGINGGAIPFRFVITQDTLEMVSTLEVGTASATGPEDTPTVINAWPITNVDLQYQINLDGETTNFYQENQERPWQEREWVKVQWDKNNMADLAPLGEYQTNLLSNCVDTGNVNTTLVTNSFFTEPPEASASTPVLTDPGASPTDYMEWTINVTLPLVWDDTTCTTAYGFLGREATELGKETETMNLKYSMKRAAPLPANPASPQPGENTYQTLLVAEKDPIRHKYGFYDDIVWNRDPNSGLLAANAYVERFDPQKPITWYFANGFPQSFQAYYTAPGMLMDQTNALMEQAGVPARVNFLNYDDPTGLDPATQQQEIQYGRQYGDIRYNMLLWMNDGEDEQAFFAGATTYAMDPRTGEIMSADIALSNFAIQDYYVQRIDSFLVSIDASLGVNSTTEWGPPTDPTTGAVLPSPCVSGTTVPIVEGALQNNLYAQNTVYQQMQTYLGYPQASYGNLGPANFIYQPDQDFYNAYFNLAHYEIFSDPAVNPYVIPLGNVGVFSAGDMWTLMQQEDQFQQLASAINMGQDPTSTYGGYDDGTTATGSAGVEASLSFINNLRTLSQAHSKYMYQQKFSTGLSAPHYDGIDSLSFEDVADHAARHCINGAWETKEEWEANLVTSYWQNVAFHEFGHSLGLQHNFMGSVDMPNYPTYADAAGNTHYADYTNSVMEYEEAMARVFLTPQWGPYDRGAISWIYANEGAQSAGATPSATAISGQNSATSPWNDPCGFFPNSCQEPFAASSPPTTAANGELNFLRCDETHEAYTPLCRTGDMGATPSEIMANDISAYEWGYKWRNLRQYEKEWDDSAYADAPQAMFADTRRFLALWVYDWSTGELGDTLRLIGVNNPTPNEASENDYLTQLTNKFNSVISSSNQMAAAYHEAMIQQSAGQRPYATVYDPFFGDVTQQGIILDKLFAMENFVGLLPTDDYDQNQAGAYLAYYQGIGDQQFTDLAQAAAISMIGGGYAVYPYFVPSAVALFAQDTHDINFDGDYNVRNWIGGYPFYTELTMLDYFQNLARQYNYTGAGFGATGCVDSTGATVLCTCGAGSVSAADGAAAPGIPVCTYDPRNIPDPTGLNGFTGPDSRRYLWSYLPDRNEWVFADRDIHVVTYALLSNYNEDINVSVDDGNEPGAAFQLELPIKYTLDAFEQFN